jgi:NAD(P)-dependent dehydrogenase (short-subunit alcohol dehydrogenase family)
MKTNKKKLLQKSIAVISGGLGGIGSSIALKLASEGCAIAIGDMLPDGKATALLKKIAARGVRSSYTQVDVSHSHEVADWVKKTEKEFGHFNIAIPNAAIVERNSLSKIDNKSWKQILKVNLDGAFYMGNAAAKSMVKNKKSGRIIFLGSWAAAVVHQSIPAYSVSKAGVRMLMQCMAVEYASKNILVNELAPGYVDAGLSGDLFKRNPSLKIRAKGKVPNKKLISAREVADQVFHLCRPDNNHMTGSVLLMDGGLSLRSV